MTEEITIRQAAEETTGAVPSGQAPTAGITGGARSCAERKDTKPMISWAALLDEAVKKPGYIHQAYSRFHNYSLGNQLLALFQCMEREIALGPLASFMKWKQLGRRVKKGEKALILCMPLSCQRTRTVKKDDGTEQEEEFTYTHFTYKAHWFVLAQTEGTEYQAPDIFERPEWNEQQALAALKIERIPFEDLNGNTQGYARRGGKIAINPLAALPFKTLFHELAHSILHCAEADMADTDQTPRSVAEVEAEAVALLCCESLGLPATDSTRVLRLPGFNNKKYQQDYHVEAHEISTATYQLSDFKPGERQAQTPEHAQAAAHSSRPAVTAKRTPSDHDWRWARDRIRSGESISVLIQRLEDYRYDKPRPQYYARRTVTRAYAKVAAKSCFYASDIQGRYIIRYIDRRSAGAMPS